MTNYVKQIDGTHYVVKEGGVEHWDYCIGANVPYLEAAATKYIVRWRKKNGLKDLEKARSYVAKRISSYQRGAGVLRGANRREAMFNRFIDDNKIGPRERNVIDLIMHWKRLDSLFEAHAQLSEIIHKYNKEEEEACEPSSAYVNQD